MILDQNKIKLILPQQAPFIMIDSLINFSDTSAETSLFVHPENLLLEKDKFSVAGMIENMAQTAAAHMGYSAFLQSLSPPVGLIAALRNLDIILQPSVNSTIFTKIEYIQTVLNIQIINASITLENKKIATVELKIFIQE